MCLWRPFEPSFFITLIEREERIQEIPLGENSQGRNIVLNRRQFGVRGEEEVMERRHLRPGRDPCGEFAVEGGRVEESLSGGPRPTSTDQRTRI